jgi:hypothetical protein
MFSPFVYILVHTVLQHLTSGYLTRNEYKSEWKEAILDYLEILLQKIQICLPVYPAFRYRFKSGTFYALSHLSSHFRQLSGMLQMNVTTEGHSDMKRMIVVFFSSSFLSVRPNICYNLTSIFIKNCVLLSCVKCHAFR